MVLADQLVRRVADHREEQRVGGQYLAIGSETDGGDVLPDGIESPRQVFILGGAFHRPAFLPKSIAHDSLMAPVHREGVENRR